jgi:hypothetical protein
MDAPSGGGLFDRLRDNEQPAYPKNLTRADWDKKKGLIAKWYGRTGVGEECDKVYDLYGKVTWRKLEMNTLMRGGGFATWASDDFNKANYDDIRKEARAQILGPMAVLAVGLYDLEKLCKDTADKFEDNKRIPKSSGAHIRQMAADARALRSDVNQETMTEYLTSMDRALMSWINDAVITGIKRSQKSEPATMKQALAKLNKSMKGASLNEFSRDAIRGLNQPIGSIAKLCDRRFARPDPAYRKMFDKLEPYARGKLVGSNAAPDVVQAKFAEVKPHIDKALSLLGKWKPPTY